GLGTAPFVVDRSDEGGELVLHQEQPGRAVSQENLEIRRTDDRCTNRHMRREAPGCELKRSCRKQALLDHGRKLSEHRRNQYDPDLSPITGNHAECDTTSHCIRVCCRHAACKYTE
ncbi:hypothetical protein TGDOM2_401390, partial [Toxoplasma gondii GAB2-2007-GAL-DOM2]